MTPPDLGQVGRVLTKTPHEIAVIIVHEDLTYGQILEGQPNVLALLKKALFEAVRDAILASSGPPK